MNKSGSIGTKTETAVVKVLVRSGWPSAERKRLSGSFDKGDITGTPGVCFEVKGGDMARTASDLDIERWLIETEIERINVRADVGVLVVHRKGVGYDHADRWWAIMPAGWLVNGTFYGLDREPRLSLAPVRLILSDLLEFLVLAGYGSKP